MGTTLRAVTGTAPERPMDPERASKGTGEGVESLDRAIAVLEAQREQLGDAVVDTALQLLLEQRDRLSRPHREQRKLVTVLFADLVGFTAMSAALDPEDVRSIVNDYFARWHQAIDHHGGVVEKFIGDAVMAVFGLHRAREDDPRRAVRAALSMAADMPDLNAELKRRWGVSLEMRVGIDTGEVVVSTLEERPGADFVAVGDVVNRASRLQGIAPAGRIVISADTCRHVRGAFALQKLPALDLKGVPHGVDAYLVIAEASTGFWPETRGVEGVSTKTVGRDLELGRLQKSFADVVEEKTWTTVTIVGDAGVGKSRLLYDFERWLATQPDAIWALRGRASPSTEDVPNGLLRSVFAGRLEISEGDDPEVVRRKWEQGLDGLLGDAGEGARAAHTMGNWLGFELGDIPYLGGLGSDPQALRQRAYSLVMTYLSRLAEQAPVVLLLEDLHWADDGTLDWLEVAGAGAGHFPLIVVATARPALFERRPHWGEGLDEHVSLRLEPLSRRASRALLAEILQRADSVPGELEELVVTSAEGNPFYIEELVKWLVEEGVIDSTGDRWRVAEQAVSGLRVPATLKGVLQARLDSLAAEERTVVERAAVVGRVFWDQAVARLAPPGAPPADPGVALDGLRSREVVFRRPVSSFDNTREFSFKHALLRDVAYESVVRSLRRRYHEMAARWLEDVTQRNRRVDEYAAVIATHYEAAGDRDAAARWYLRAGRQAAAVCANQDALRVLGWAQEMASDDDPSLRFDVLLAREEVLDCVGDRPAQRAVLDELAGLDRVDDGRRTSRLLAEARWAFFHGDYVASTSIADHAAALARSAGRGELEIAALVAGGKSHAFRGEHDTARRLLGESLDRARDAGDVAAAAESLRLLAVVAGNLNEHDDALALLEQARTALREIHDLEGEGLVTGQMGALLYGMGRLDEARAATEESLAIFVGVGHRLRQSIAIGNLSSIAIEQNRLGEALRRGTEALRLAEEVEDTEGTISSLLRLGDIARLTGDHPAASRYLSRALAKGRQAEAFYLVAHALASVAVIAAADGRFDEALDAAVTGREQARLGDIPATEALLQLVEGLVLLDAGRADDAVAALREALARTEELGLEGGRQESQAALAAALMQIGEGEEATRLVADLVPVIDLDRSDGRIEPSRMLLNCLLVLDAVGDGRAAEVRAVAVAYLRNRADRIDDDRLRDGFLDAPANVVLARVAGRAA